MNEAEVIKSITFYGFSFLVLLFSILTIFANRILYSLLYAVITFFCAGAIFFSLGADYNAVVQIIIYGIAVPVIFLFAIMFTSKKENKLAYVSYSPRFFIALVSILILLMFLWYSVKLAIHVNNLSTNKLLERVIELNSFDSVYSIANGLYINYALPFLFMALCVLTSVIGISVLNVIKENKHVK